MKTRDSGMPDASMWKGFFDPAMVLGRLGLTNRCTDIVDFGCGYGTFSVPAAQIVRGVVYALDIDPAMLTATSSAALAVGVRNVVCRQRDFVVDGTGLPDGSVEYALLFNILHAEEPLLLLREAARILVAGGHAAIMHWASDIPTPRGPSLDIRPRPEQCRQWGEHAGFSLEGPPRIELPPYHYGLVMVKNSNQRDC